MTPDEYAEAMMGGGLWYPEPREQRHAPRTVSDYYVQDRMPKCPEHNHPMIDGWCSLCDVENLCTA